MLLARLHRRALHGYEKLVMLRQQLPPQQTSTVPDFLDVPTSTAPWLSSMAGANCNANADTSTSTSPSATRIVCMSDTHGKHNDIPFLPPGDLLVHAGDFTKYGETHAVQDLSRYFERLQGPHNLFRYGVLCCAGNHDITFHPEYYARAWSRHVRRWTEDPSSSSSSSSAAAAVASARQALQNCTYLQDSATTILLDKSSSSLSSSSSSSSAVGTQPGERGREKQGRHISVYGSPWTPEFCRWAFNLPRGEALRRVWSRIPDSTDILITHGPPHGRGDLTLHSSHFGCRDLLHEIQHRIKPRVHVYGHIHEGYGTSFDGQTLYVNASNLDLGYEANNPCIVIDLPLDQTKPAMVVQPQCTLHDTDDFVSWLTQNDYHSVAELITERSAHRPPDLLPTGNQLFHKSSYHTICDKLFLHRRKMDLVRRELRGALCQLYAESFS